MTVKPLSEEDMFHSVFPPFRGIRETRLKELFVDLDRQLKERYKENTSALNHILPNESAIRTSEITYIYNRIKELFGPLMPCRHEFNNELLLSNPPQQKRIKCGELVRK